MLGCWNPVVAVPDGCEAGVRAGAQHMFGGRLPVVEVADAVLALVGKMVWDSCDISWWFCDE